MFCSNCGESQSASAKFCSACGTEINGLIPVGAGSKTTGKSRLTKPAFIAGAIVLLATGGAFAAVNSIQNSEFLEKQKLVASVFPDVVDKCKNLGFGFESDFSYLALDGIGQEDFLGASYSEITCVIDALKMPKADKARWTHTRALDGVQEAAWSSADGSYKITASWTYHPDNGCDINFKIESEFLDGYTPAPASSESVETS